MDVLNLEWKTPPDSAIFEEWTDKLWVQQLLAEAELEALECESKGQLEKYFGSGTEKKNPLQDWCDEM